MKKFTAIFVLIAAVLMLAGYSTYKLMNARTFQLVGELVARVETEKKAVALTFDDGPNDSTKNVLAALEQEKLKATFFLIGESMKKNSDAAKQLVEAGHEIGNHTYSHQRMILKSPSFIAEEIEKTDMLIREAGYQKEILFRPPYGKKIIGLPYYLKKHDRKTVMWDIEPESYPEVAKNRESIVKYVVDHTNPGSIILLHIWAYPLEDQRYIIANIAKGLKEKGFSFETASELLQK